MLNILRRTSPKARLARQLYDRLTAASRQPIFFRHYGVADTIDGAVVGWRRRFDHDLDGTVEPGTEALRQMVVRGALGG